MLTQSPPFYLVRTVQAEREHEAAQARLARHAREAIPDRRRRDVLSRLLAWRTPLQARPAACTAC